jgi:hypothetical protein
MNDITKTLVKNGLKGLATLEEDYFKENITHALAFKLNECINEVYKDCSSKLLYSKVITEKSEGLTNFINFVENFKPGKYEFQNNSLLNITDSDVESLKNLFETLNSNNRQKMVNEVFSDAETFKNHVEFYNRTKGLVQ